MKKEEKQIKKTSKQKTKQRIKQNPHSSKLQKTPPNTQLLATSQLITQPVPKQQQPLQTAPSFIAERDTVWRGISLWSAGVSCPGCAPSQLLVCPPPPRCQGGVRS